jgi:hypothetical protein
MKRKKQKQADKYKRNNTLPFVAKLLSASRHKSLLLYLPILLIISVFTFSVDDQEAIILYLDKLQELSEHKIKNEQKLSVQNFYLNNTNRDPLQKERHRIRKEFNSKKHKAKLEWEAQYKIKWPQVKITKKNASRAVDKNQKNDNFVDLNFAITDREFEAHHCIPINAGGCNQWWNISPLSSRNHHLLHDSIEEKACFSHDFLHKKFMRFILKLRIIFFEYFGGYINKKGTNYAT